MNQVALFIVGTLVAFAIWLGKRDENLVMALEKAEDALVWASGSSDFNEGGQARKGWLSLGRPAQAAVRAALRRRGR